MLRVVVSGTGAFNGFFSRPMAASAAEADDVAYRAAKLKLQVASSCR